MVYVVLGMHKSGTTLVSQMLHTSGINMGEFSASLNYDQGNKFERRATQAINKRLLQGCTVPNLKFAFRRHTKSAENSAGFVRNSDSVALIRHRVLSKRLQQNPERDNIQKLVRQYEQAHDNWGFKDPRTCLTYPAWREQLPEHKLIIVFRNYVQLLQRYHLLGKRRYNLFAWYRVLNAWVFYNLQILNYLQTQPAFVINYEQFMQSDRGIQDFSSFVAVDLVDTRKKSSYRNRLDKPFTFPLFLQPVLKLLPVHPETVFSQLLEHTQ